MMSYSGLLYIRFDKTVGEIKYSSIKSLETDEGNLINVLFI